MNASNVGAAWPYPFWIAHRGAGKLAPENTLAAFRLGASHGYRAFECDVKLSADGVPFLLHDASLERTTSGRGDAADHAWSELSRLDAGRWHSRGFAGEPVASLESVARYSTANGWALNVELKPSPGAAHQTGAAVAAAVRRLWAGAAAPLPLLSSFDPAALAAALEEAPEIARALLLDQLHQGWLEQALALRCSAVVTRHALLDAALLVRLQASGLRALVYTVNDPVDARRLLGLGIDGIITDAVDRFSPAVRL